MTPTFMETHTTRYRSDDNQYPNDPLIPQSMQWRTDPYWRSGYDHGHICPSADRLNSAEANYQTFFMTNMQPMYNGYNAGLWGKMENKMRIIARQCDTLYVCKGGTIDGGSYNGFNKIYRTEASGMLVPRFYYMALLRANGGQYTAMAFWSDQISDIDDPGTALAKFAISIDELEKRTGIDFFCNLPDKIENEVEKTYNSTLSWGL